MQIIFNGIPLATDPSDSGFDAIEGFEPDVTEETDVNQFLRVKWSEPQDRGNALATISGTIYPTTTTTVGEAVSAMLNWFQTIPKSGPLIIVQDGIQTTFPIAVLKRCRALNHLGVSYAVELTFLGADPRPTNNAVLDSSGAGVTDSSGHPVTDS